MALKSYTIAIDIGESRVTAIAGSLNESGALEVGAIASRSSQGIRMGRIDNIAQINDALSGVIADLETKLNIQIEQAYTAIAGEFLRTEHHSETIKIEDPNNGVATTDVAALHALMRNVLPSEDDKIIESKPEVYTIEGRREVKSAVGVFGRTLSARFNFVLCEKEALKRLNLAFMQASITLKQCFANSIVTAEAVLTKEEMESGVAMVDLGEGLTNIAIYYGGTLRYAASIPIGGSALNNDLASLMVHERNIEEIKRNYGSAIASLADEGSVCVAGRTSRENRNIPIYNIAVAIEERLSDITIFVQREIRDAGYEGRLNYGIVLTGGGANLRNIDTLFKRDTQLEVRIATPEMAVAESSREDFDSPEFSTIIGVLRRGVEMDAAKGGKPCAVELKSPEQEAEEQREREEAEEAERLRLEEERLAKEAARAREEERNEEFSKNATQAELDLDEEVDEEEEEEYDDEPQEEENNDGGFSLKSIFSKMNGLFSSNGDTKLE